jgi:hypothetical protein
MKNIKTLLPKDKFDDNNLEKINNDEPKNIT